MIPFTFVEHQYMLLYDTKLNELELFDPYGAFNFLYLNPRHKVLYKKCINSIKNLFNYISKTNIL